MVVDQSKAVTDKIESFVSVMEEVVEETSIVFVITPFTSRTTSPS